MADLMGAQAMGVVHGEAGLGKTFAVDDAVLACLTAAEACWTSFPARPTMRQVTLDLLGLLTRAHVAGSRFQATHELVEVLAGRPRLLVIDEAQRLNRECIELLRHLHDHPATRFGLLLVGGDGCWEVLSREPMLRSRIYRVGQGCDIHIAVLFQVWLRAEQVRDLVVLRAHQLAGTALAWLLDLTHRVPVRLWLCAPGPLVDLDTAAARLTPAVFLERVRPHRRCRCDDLNRLTAASVIPAETPGPASPRLTPYTGRLLRRLHDPEAAALATATLLLGRPDSTVLAAAEALVAATSVTSPRSTGAFSGYPSTPEACCVAGLAGRCCRRRGRPTSPRPTSRCGWRPPGGIPGCCCSTRPGRQTHRSPGTCAPIPAPTCWSG